MAPKQKMQLSDFDLVRTLGVGSFGRVKYGKYKHDGNNYAVKFMKKHEIIKLKQVQGWGRRLFCGSGPLLSTQYTSPAHGFTLVVYCCLC